jgi:hypothetical protein
MRIRTRINLFTLMRIRIQLLLKVRGICDHQSIDPPGLHFEPLGLHCERPRPSTRLYFELLNVLILTLMRIWTRIRIQIFTLVRNRIRNPVFFYLQYLQYAYICSSCIYSPSIFSSCLRFWLLITHTLPLILIHSTYGRVLIGLRMASLVKYCPFMRI